MSDKEKVQRFPLWLSKVVGIVFLVFSFLFAPGVWQAFVHNGIAVETVYMLVLCVSFFFLGSALLFSKKGWPRTRHDMAILRKQAREEPDCLNEALSPEERLEHLEVMREQGVLSQENYEEKRKEILKQL